MPWVRIDDQYPEHPKVTQAGHLAAWLNVCGLAYCNRLLTDGFVAEAMVARLSSVPQPAKRAAELVAAGLWDRVEGGYQIHDYLKYQKTGEQIRTERASAAARQQRARDRASERRGGSHAVTHGAVTVPPHPLPSTPTQDYSNPVEAVTDHAVTESASPADFAAHAARVRSLRKTGSLPDASNPADESSPVSGGSGEVAL